MLKDFASLAALYMSASPFLLRIQYDFKLCAGFAPFHEKSAVVQIN